MKINEEFKNLIPALSIEEFSQLEQNIIKDGCRDPLVLWGDILIDGHNRYKICTTNNIEFTTVNMDFDNQEDVIQWIIKNQFGRRNISNYVRATLALRFKDSIAAKAKENKGSNQFSIPQISAKPSIDTREELAKIAEVSHDTIYKVFIIEDKATDEIKKQLKSGDISINQAYKDIKSVEKAVQLEAKKQEIISQTKDSVSDNPPIVSNMDCVDWLDIQPMCDLLFTDPPYSTDVDDINAFVSIWLNKALKKVKDTGFAFICIGAYPKEIQAYLNANIPEHLELEQILVWEYKNTLGNNPKDRYKLNYQNVLFYRGINAPDLDCPITNEQWAVMEINAPDGRQADRYHTWQKPIELAERLIRHTTKVGDIILDPFCCTGTFIIAANQLDRNGFGCDINADNLQIAIDRGCKYGE